MAGEVTEELEYINWSPDDPSRAFWMHMPRLRRILAAHGLHIVTEAERQQMVQSKLDAVVTRAERKVLEAWGSAKPEWLRDMRKTISGPAEWVAWMKDTLDAELARRGGTRG